MGSYSGDGKDAVVTEKGLFRDKAFKDVVAAIEEAKEMHGSTPTTENVEKTTEP